MIFLALGKAREDFPLRVDNGRLFFFHFLVYMWLFCPLFFLQFHRFDRSFDFSIYFFMFLLISTLPSLWSLPPIFGILGTRSLRKIFRDTQFWKSKYNVYYVYGCSCYIHVNVLSLKYNKIKQTYFSCSSIITYITLLSLAYLLLEWKQLYLKVISLIFLF